MLVDCGSVSREIGRFFLTKNTKKSTENFVNTKFRTIFVVQSNNKFYEKIKQKRERPD